MTELDNKIKQMESKLTRYKRSRNELYRVMVDVALNLDTDDDNERLKVLSKLVDLLGKDRGLSTISRQWTGQQHWGYMVNDPWIVDKTNPSYSPFYNYALDANGKPLQLSDQFGEMDRLDVEDDGTRKLHCEKVCPDAYFVNNNVWDFGDAWDGHGNIIKFDNNGRPALSGWSKWFYDLMLAMVDYYSTSATKSRNLTQAFLNFHVQDDQASKVDGDVEHTPVHAQYYTQLPNNISRYQLMKWLGVDFDFYIKTFKWIGQQSNNASRALTFINQLTNLLMNFQVVVNKKNSLLYLVHESKSALAFDKPLYRPSWVFEFLPDQPNTSFSKLSGAWDDTPLNWTDDAIVANLHSPLNQKYHSIDMVGRTKNEHKRFTISQLKAIRTAASHGPSAVMEQFAEFVDKDELYLADFWDLLRCSLDTEDFHGYEFDGMNGISPLFMSYKRREIEALGTMKKHRNVMLILGDRGGSGKSRLAKALLTYMYNGRVPSIATQPGKGKTVDLFESYNGEPSVVVDEFTEHMMGLNEFKAITDPWGDGHTSSRNSNQNLYNMRDLAFTGAYRNGVSELIKKMLAYSPGASEFGFLECHINGDGEKVWSIKQDPVSQDEYMTQLSQIARRLPVVINVSYTDKATTIKISILNCQNANASDNNVMKYVATADSTIRVNTLINDSMTDEQMLAVVKRVDRAITNLKAKAKADYDKYGSNVFLDDVDPDFVTSADLGLMPANHQNSKAIHVMGDTTYDDGAMNKQRTLERARDDVQRLLDISTTSVPGAVQCTLMAFCDYFNKNLGLHLFVNEGSGLNYDDVVDDSQFNDLNLRLVHIDNLLDLMTTRRSEVDANNAETIINNYLHDAFTSTVKQGPRNAVYAVKINKVVIM